MVAGPPIKTFQKDPDAVLPYTIDWDGAAADDGPWLDDGDVISTSSWGIPAGITEDSNSKTNTTTTIILSGGIHNIDYDLVNSITTTSGLATDRTIRVQVRER